MPDTHDYPLAEVLGTGDKIHHARPVKLLGDRIETRCGMEGRKTGRDGGTWCPECLALARTEDLRKARRNAVIAYCAAANHLLAHVDAEVPQPIGPALLDCDWAREEVLKADLALNAEQFQLDMVKLIGRRGDQPPIKTRES